MASDHVISYPPIVKVASHAACYSFDGLTICQKEEITLQNRELNQAVSVKLLFYRSYADFNRQLPGLLTGSSIQRSMFVRWAFRDGIYL